ncbi:MAG: YihY/virulence factor BrkB family protein [Lentisphaeria bacterium]|nr:YihY/virulence factor BrkB family protein [Lentisphaeria bacterium]
MKNMHYFFTHHIWTFQASKLPKRLALPLQICRVIILTLRYFIKNKCSLHASALTFFTLLSIVPIAGMLFGIAKGYGYDEILKAKLLENMAGQRQVAEWIIQFADNALNKASGGLVAGVGVILLMWSVLKLLTSIESSFNEIWGVRQGRNMMRKVSDYLTLLILCPLLLLFLATSTAFLLARIQQTLSVCLPFADGFLKFGMIFIAKMIPFLLAWGAFTFLYIFIPNTKVTFRAGLVSGAVTGIFYTILQFGYIYAQKYLSGYNAIYGSFAAVPFFLLWLQISWNLILFGAQSAFTVQNVHAYELSSGETNQQSPEYRYLCALRIMIELAHAFKNGKGAMAADRISTELEIPIRTTRSVLFDLYTVGLATRISTDIKTEEICQIAVPPENMTPVKIFQKLSKNGNSGHASESLNSVRNIYQHILQNAEQSPDNVSLLELPSFMK